MASTTSNLIKTLRSQSQQQTPVGSDMFIPNHSGDHSAGRVLRTATNATDIVNKGYADLFLPLTGGTVSGTLTYKIVRTTVADLAYTVLTTDHLVVYTSITATRIVTLVAAATAGAGKTLIVKDESGSVTPAIKITVDGNGAETIDGAVSKDITVAYGVLRLYCNGTNWFTI